MGGDDLAGALDVRYGDGQSTLPRLSPDYGAPARRLRVLEPVPVGEVRLSTLIGLHARARDRDVTQCQSDEA